MTVTDDFLKNNERYAAGFGKGELAMPPATHVAIIACMDARLDPGRALGLEEGDAHVIRNAGGVVTDDAIRRWPSRNGSSARRRSSSSTTPIAGCSRSLTTT